MAAADNFWIFFYEKEQLYSLLTYWKIIQNQTPKMISQEDHDNLGKLVERVKKFDYKRFNYLLVQQKFLDSRQWKKEQKLKDELDEMYDEYIEMGSIDYRTNGKEKVMAIIFSSFEERPIYKDVYSTYQYLIKSDIIRNKKYFPITDEIILKTFTENPEFYRESLFLDTDPDLTEMLDTYASFFQKYMDTNKPVKHKNSASTADDKIKCNESKNGILRGVVHKIGYSGFGGKDKIDYMMDIINSNYLEVQFKDYNPTSGIFTTLLGNQNVIRDSYGSSSMGIYFIISLSVLDDFDYWGGEHNRGYRTETNFYKGICYNCGDELEKFSAAERIYMDYINKNFMKMHELIFPNDIKISKYVEQIYIPCKFDYKYVMKSKKVPPHIKKIITNVENRKKVYRKGCKGNAPKRIDEKLLYKMCKKVAKRENMKDIVKIDVMSINRKRRVKLSYDPTKSANNYIFPIPE